MNDGFIKMYRSLLDWEWYQDANTTRLFIHLLLIANWEDSRYQGYLVPKGSLVCGRKKLAEDLGMTERAIRTSLKHLKATNEVTIKATNRFSIITIVNWEKYQGRKDELTNRMTNQVPTSDQQVTTYKEIKNIRREEYNKPTFDANKGTIKTNYDFESLRREIRNR